MKVKITPEQSSESDYYFFDGHIHPTANLSKIVHHLRKKGKLTGTRYGDSKCNLIGAKIGLGDARRREQGRAPLLRTFFLSQACDSKY